MIYTWKRWQICSSCKAQSSQMMISFVERASYGLIGKKCTNYTIKTNSTSLSSVFGFCKWCSLNLQVTNIITLPQPILIPCFILYHVEWRFKLAGKKATTTSASLTHKLWIARIYWWSIKKHTRTYTSTYPFSTTRPTYCFLTTLGEFLLSCNSFNYV